MIELNKIYNMDCLEGLRQIDSGLIDLIVTDPPYGISFMGKKWDKAVPPLDIWQECYRVLKSGSFMFVMSIPRLDCQFEMAKRLKLAQFNIGFTPIYWAYASGFPKAMNISKKVVDFLGVKRDKITPTGSMHKDKQVFGDYSGLQDSDIPITEQAKRLDGSYAGFQPKPAVEVIIVAMKPLNQDSYTEQALSNRKGITWLDDCRIPFVDGDEIDAEVWANLRISESELKSSFGVNKKVAENYQKGRLTFKGDGTGQNNFAQSIVDKRGRFPSNLLISDDVLSGNYSDVDDTGSFSRYFSLDNWWQERIKRLPDEVTKVFPFLIVPKASPNEKQEGLDDQPLKQWVNNSKENKPQNRSAVYRKNFHPTVKPLDLMSYLVILGSRARDLIVDPFAGSGTTAMACYLWNRDFIGFEMNKEYYQISEARINYVMQQKKVNQFAD